MKLEQIIEDKERREQDAQEALQANKAVMEMVRRNKIKKQELKKARALEAARVKIEQRALELEEVNRLAEQAAIQKSNRESLKRRKKEKKAAKKSQMMKEEVSNLQSELKKIEESAKEAKKRFMGPDYKVTKDRELIDGGPGDEGNEILLMQAKAKTHLTKLKQAKENAKEKSNGSFVEADNIAGAQARAVTSKGSPLTKKIKKKSKKSDKTKKKKVKKEKLRE